MGKTLRILFLLALIAAGAVAQAGPAEREPLVVVHSANTPPLSSVGLNGEPKGLVIDYWQAWSEKTGIPVRIVQVSWPDSIAMVRDGRADIHGGLYFSEERDRYLDFSDPYFAMEAAIFVRKTLGIDSMDQLGNLEVAVLNQGYSEYYLKQHHPNLRGRGYDSSELLAAAAISGEVDAMLTEKTTFIHQLGAQGKISEFKPLETLYRRELRAAVAKGNHELLQTIRNGESLFTERDRDKIFSQWVILASATSGWLVIALVGGFLVLAAATLFALYPR